MTQEIWRMPFRHQKPEFHLTRRTYVRRDLEGKVLSNILCIYSMTLRYQQLLAIVIYLVILKADLVKTVPNLVVCYMAVVVYSTLQRLYTAPMHSWVVPKLSFIEPKPLCSTKFGSLLYGSGGIQYLTKVIYNTNALICTTKAIL